MATYVGNGLDVPAEGEGADGEGAAEEVAGAAVDADPPQPDRVSRSAKAPRTTGLARCMSVLPGRQHDASGQVGDPGCGTCSGTHPPGSEEDQQGGHRQHAGAPDVGD